MPSAKFSATVVALFAPFMLGTVPAVSGERIGAFAGGGIGGASSNINQSAGLCNYYSCNSSNNSNLLVLEGHGGYRFDPHFALEGKVMGGANNNDYYGEQIRLSAVSIRAVGLIPVGSIVDCYALVGAYSGQSEIGNSGTQDESGLVYGGGAQLNFGARGNYGVRLEYEVYDTNSLLDKVQTFTASFQYNFW